MKQSRVRTSATNESNGQSELQRKLQSMVLACRDNKTNTGSPSSGNKLSNTELRIKRAEAQSQINFAKTSPAAINTLPNQAPAVGIKKSNLDPLQNCYGRPSVVVPPNGSTGGGGLKGILTKSATPKIPKGKRVTWNLDLESDIPSRPDSPYNPEPSNYILNNTSAGTGGGVSSGGTGASTSTSALPNVDQKSPISGNSKKSPLFQSPKPARPSLTEQLSQIANRASGITADIKAKAGIADAVGEQPIFTFPAKNFTVGNLQCRYPSPAVFYRDRLEYIFHHPFQSAEIHLILYYRDMQSLTLSPNPQPGKILFRVPRKLVHFASDYDPTKHYVTLFLSSSLALESIRADILPLIPGRGAASASSSSSSAGGGTSLMRLNSPSLSK